MRYLEVLINSGADINVRCDAGVTPLTIATSNGMLKAAQFLVDCGADINISDCEGWDCLQFNILWNEHESIKFCLQYKSNYLNVTIEGYILLLHAAALHRDMRTIEILTASQPKGLDIEAKDRMQQTARDLANMRENVRPEWKVAFESLLQAVETQNHETEEEGNKVIEDSDSGSEFSEDALEIHNSLQ